MTALLFCTNVLVWGFTWIAITIQIREAPAEIALFYRMALAAATLALVLRVTGRLRAVTWRRQPFLVLMGLCLFCANYLLVYGGTAFLASGVVALVFSTAIIFNALNSMLLFGDRQTLRFGLGAASAIAGLGCVFWRDLAGLDITSASLTGGALVLAGTYVFSLGNMVSRRNNEAGLDLPTATAWGMGWGAVLLALYALMRGQSFALPVTPGFLISLAYLAIPGTAIGFLSYLELVRRLGAPLAAFSTVLYPVIALMVSTVVEDYRWSAAALLGLALIAGGNVLVFLPPAWLRKAAAITGSGGVHQAKL